MGLVPVVRGVFLNQVRTEDWQLRPEPSPIGKGVVSRTVIHKGRERQVSCLSQSHELYHQPLLIFLSMLEDLNHFIPDLVKPEFFRNQKILRVKVAASDSIEVYEGNYALTSILCPFSDPFG